MKFSETQDNLYEKTVFSEMWEGEFLSPYEHILNEIVSRVMKQRHHIWVDDYGYEVLKIHGDEMMRKI